MVKSTLSDKKILIVDDEDTIRFLLAEMLQQLGYRTSEAANKTEAVQMVKASTFDLIFIDMVYANADYNGFDIINIIQGLQPNSQIIILTAKPSMHSAIQALRCRIFDYLEKPIDLEILSAVTSAAFAKPTKRAERTVVAQENNSTSPAVTLTNRESDILKMLVKGFSYSEIGQHLDCKTSTIQWHIKNIYRKLGVTSKSEAVYEALCTNLIDIN